MALRAALALLAAAALAASGCAPSGGPASGPPAASSSTTPISSPEAPSMATPSPAPSGTTLVLASDAFADGEPIPREHSCRGEDLSPPLAWAGVPAGAGALVLFVDDPDGRDWVHWSVLDLPPADGSLPRGVPATAPAPQQGRNDFGRVGYGGPCPPSGVHHYHFTLYALAAPLGLPGHPDGAAVRAALGRATVLGRFTLVGTFRA